MVLRQSRPYPSLLSCLWNDPQTGADQYRGVPKSRGSCGFVRVLVPTSASLPGLYGVLQVSLDWEAFTFALLECPRFLALPSIRRHRKVCIQNYVRQGRGAWVNQSLLRSDSC